MLDWWGPSIYEYYAATEGGGTIVDARGLAARSPAPSASAWPISEVVILDDDGNELPAGRARHRLHEDGRPASFEYHKDEEKTDKSLERQGFFTVGDVGYLDEDGYLFLCDRKIDMIISGGVNIYPAEIEACCCSTRRSATSPCSASRTTTGARRSRRSSSRPTGVEPGAELAAELIAFCREQPGRFKCPKSFDFTRRAAARPERQALQAQAARPVLGRPRPRDLSMATDEVLSAPHVMEFAYTRTTGPVVGASSPGCATARSWGSRARRARSSCRRPSTTRRPPKRSSEFVEVGQEGVVTTLVVDRAAGKQPLQTPFAWALIKLDGADTAMLHAVDAARKPR